MRRISTEERRRRLAVRHRLVADTRVDDVAAIADDLVALHSADPATVFLSAGARMTTPSVEAIEHALYGDRSLVRHHSFRRTLWVMTPVVARWAHAAATVTIAAAERRTLIEAVGAEPDIRDAEAWVGAAVASIRHLLDAEGPLSTREVGRRLPELNRGVTLRAHTSNPVSVAAHTRLLLLAGFEAELVRTAPRHGWNTSEYEWVPTERWLDQPLVGAESRTSSARVMARWLDAFGPATETDIRWWTGWTVATVRRALDDIGAEPVGLDGDRRGWIAVDDVIETDGTPWIAMLPGLDPTTMGWKERGWYLGDVARARTFDRRGNAGPTIWRNGEVIGGWVQRDDGSVAYELYTDLSPAEQVMLDEQIDRFGLFAGDTRVKVRFPAENQRELLASPPVR